MGRRRTPGLRSEEVANLAGVSVSWYTWLEQGRDIRVSTAALERLGGDLRLDRGELEHLFALSLREPPSPRSGEVLGEGLIDLVQAVDPVPAYVRNDRLDILAWNTAVADLFVALRHTGSSGPQHAAPHVPPFFVSYLVRSEGQDPGSEDD